MGTDLYEAVFRRLLQEAGTPDLGNVQFARQRMDPVPDRKEKDTPEEASLFVDIHYWLDDASMSASGAEKLKALMKDPKYGKFFHAPKEVKLYRGMVLSHGQLAALLGQDPDDVPLMGKKAGSFDVVPNKGKHATSWTKDRDTAVTFATGQESTGGGSINMDEMADPRAVLVVASPHDNSDVMLDLDDIVWRIDDWKPYEHEHEVLGLGPVDAHTVTWWNL